jgi:hypothetical protein
MADFLTDVDESKTMTDLKIDLADGCDSVLDLLGQQLDNGNCNSIVRVDVGYFHSRRNDPASLQRQYRTSRLSNDELNLVFQGIVCCLPKMKTLVIMSYFRADAMSLPVAALEMLFRRADHLEILFLHQIKLIGSPHEFRIMAKSLDRHPALKRVNLHCCSNSTNNDNNDNNLNIEINERRTTSTTNTNSRGNVMAPTSLDHLVCGLAKLPTLYYLSLDQVPISEVSIRALSQSISLRDVSFYNMPQIKASLPIFFQTLRNNSPGINNNGVRIMGRPTSSCNLRGLRIRSCDLDQTEAVMITHMLEKNSSLESVVFYVDSWEDYGAPLAAALACNTSLKRLEVGIGKNHHHHHHDAVGGGVEALGVAEAVEASAADQQGSSNNGVHQHSSTSSTPVLGETKDIKHAQAATELAQALQSNHKTSLRYFCLNLFHANSNVIYTAYMQPFGKMLESNYVLENFLLQGANGLSVMSPLVGFLLRLNQRSGLNRRRLFQAVVEHESHKGDSRQLWVDTLGRHAEDLSILYYLVCRNPNLVGGAVATTMDCLA